MNSAFIKLQHTVLKAATDEAQASMQSAVHREIELSSEVEKNNDRGNVQNAEIELSDDEAIVQPAKIKIKGDGTWQRRGFQSLNGAVTVIGAETEKVLDHEVLSSYCQECTKWQEKNDQDFQKIRR